MKTLISKDIIDYTVDVAIVRERTVIITAYDSGDKTVTTSIVKNSEWEQLVKAEAKRMGLI